jgi:hypothetical protein
MTEARDFEAEIERLLGTLAERPSDLELHRAVRTASLRYKAAGGPPLGSLAWFRIPERDPVRQLIRVERCWAHDTNDIERAVGSCAAARRDVDFAPVLDWLEELLRSLTARAPV